MGPLHELTAHFSLHGRPRKVTAAHDALNLTAKPRTLPRWAQVVDRAPAAPGPREGSSDLQAN